MKFRIVFFVILAGFLSICISAATVSVQIFESGIRKDAPRVEASTAWENGLMDALFDDGDIVSNAETTRLVKPGLPSSSVGLVEALNGGAEFIVHISLEYAKPKDKTRLSPYGVTYRLSDESGRSLLQDEKKDIPPTISGSEDEQNAKEIARIIIGRMKKDK